MNKLVEQLWSAGFTYKEIATIVAAILHAKNSAEFAVQYGMFSVNIISGWEQTDKEDVG